MQRRRKHASHKTYCAENNHLRSALATPYLGNESLTQLKANMVQKY